MVMSAHESVVIASNRNTTTIALEFLFICVPHRCVILCDIYPLFLTQNNFRQNVSSRLMNA